MDVLENGIFRCLWICSQNISKYRNSCLNGPYLIVLQLSQIWALFKREREWEKPTTDCKVTLHKSFSELFLLVQCTTCTFMLAQSFNVKILKICGAKLFIYLHFCLFDHQNKMLQKIVLKHTINLWTLNWPTDLKQHKYISTQ